MYEEIGKLMATSFLLVGLCVGMIGIANNPDKAAVNSAVDQERTAAVIDSMQSISTDVGVDDSLNSGEKQGLGKRSEERA